MQPRVTVMDAKPKVCRTAPLKCCECSQRRICLPATLLDDELRYLQGSIRHNRCLARQQHLFRANEPATHVYALRSGSLKSYLTGIGGKELITGFVFPGELVGLDVFAGERSGCHVVALESSTVCAIPVDALEELLTSSAQLRSNLFKSISHQLQVEQAHLRHSRESADQRFIAFVLDLSARFARRGLSPTRFTLPMTRAEIGSYLGLTTETVSRLFTRYRRLGLIESNAREICLLDVRSLLDAREALPQRAASLAE